jgi:hypothetical protein
MMQPRIQKAIIKTHRYFSNASDKSKAFFAQIKAMLLSTASRFQRKKTI